MPTSKEDWLLEEHERYMQEVSESGMPRWIYDLYQSPYEQPKEDHQPDSTRVPGDDSTP